MRDIQGNGWDMSAPFTVVPEPSAFVLASVAAIGIVALWRRKMGKR